MAKLFPFRPESTHESEGPRLVDLEDEVAEEVFAALSSETARSILSRLYESPATASDVAEAVDTSLQNVRYHLDKLEDAGIVEPVDTWYSSRGTEMTVYAPTNEPLVLAAGSDDSKGVLRRALSRIVGAIGVLALASVLIDRAVDTFGGISPRESPSVGDYTGSSPDGTPTGEVGALQTGTPGGADTPTSVPTVVEEGGLGNGGGTPDLAVESATDTTTPQDPPSGGTSPEAADLTTEALESVTQTPSTELATDGGVDLVSGLPPGAMFFTGGLLVLSLAVAWWYLRQYRPLYG